MQQYDTVIIGAGHNGLVCAGYLARAGQRVLVLEAGESVGGLAASREFHPGFKVGVAHTLQHLSEKVVKDLDLARYGFDGVGSPLRTTALDRSGEHIYIWEDTITGGAAGEASSYREYRAFMTHFAEALAPSWMKTMPRIGNNSLREILTFAQIGLKLRMLGKEEMREFLRIAALPARDLMDENFDSELLKAALSWDGLVGSRQAPRSPNNTVLTMLYRMTGRHQGAHSLPAGGIESLVNALRDSAEARGVELRLRSPVERLSVQGDEDGLRVTGVVLEDNTEISAQRVVSATDPKRTFLDLLGVEHLEIEFSNRVNRLRSEGMVAKLHLALSDLPKFTGLDKPEGRLIIAPDMDTIEFAYDDAKYGALPEHPVMEVTVPSLVAPSMAPWKQHVLSASVMYVPHKLKGGWNDEAHNTLRERLIDTLCQYAPMLREQILHAQLLTPDDLEKDWLVSGGHWHHGELALDQMLMMRPTYEAGQYSTPVPGLYLCSAGSHPGGGLSGMAGHNAAGEILR